jgi:pimeloyl-ACP methyl ester carboxylesterase
MTPWVLLRGLTREARHWGDFPDMLGQAMAGAPVICLDLPGNGERYRERSPVSVEAMADDCHTQLEAELLALKLSPPCRLLAMSLGAMVAVAWARRHPVDLTGAALINTSLRPFSPVYQRLKPKNYLRILSLLLGQRSHAQIESTILEMTSNCSMTPANRAALLADWVRWRRQRPVAAANAIRQLLAAAQFRASRQAPPLQFALLGSRGDQLVDSRCSDHLAAAWGAPLFVHPTAGHDLPLDDPEWVIQQLQTFHSET